MTEQQRLTDRKREAIVQAAIAEFRTHGFEATSVDKVAARAEVSKRTLYNHFPSKDAVVAAYLRQREEQWQDKLHGIWEEVGDDPALQIVAYVRGYAHPVEDEVFRGSAFINAAGILTAAGVRDADSVATRILYLVEGAVAVGGVRRDESCLRDAEYFIELLLEECGLSVEAVRAVG
jgi:AcrR family transcriptional regulator